MYNTFQKYSKNISDFFQKILMTNPDYIVPVERKGCKLIRSLNIESDILSKKIRYKQFFSNTKPNILGKKIAIIDDATKYTSTLYEYRIFFEEQGAIVDTYSFVGQDSLRTAEREQYDKKAEIFQYLKESTYQEYIIQQSIELSKDDHSFDIDHLVFRKKITNDQFLNLKNEIYQLGEIQYTNDVYTPTHITKLCLYNFNFPISLPFTNKDGIFKSRLDKIRIAYNSQTRILSIVPLHFVLWDVKSFYSIKETLKSLKFEMPYEINDTIEYEGMYMNILYTSNLYMLKTFFSKIASAIKMENYTIDDYDLTAYIGNTRADLITKSAMCFLQKSSEEQLSTLSQMIEVHKEPVFSSVMHFMKELRSKYEQLIEKNNSVLGTRYFISFDELISRYHGRASLIKWIDILCDRGVLVTRNVNMNGLYCRACRSGEGDSDHIEKKAAILLPIVINICGTKTEKTCRISSTMLNKLLANLAYDYPMDKYDFHNFYTKPYLYGPFTYAKNQLNEEVEVPLYDVCKISRYCIRDEKTGDFLAVRQENIPNEINSFSQSDSVPLSEITSYIDFLNKISIKFDKADSLNQLIICRDQDIYYRHVHYDIVLAHSNIIKSHRSISKSKAEQCLRDAAKVANAAQRKLKYNQKELFDYIKEFLGDDIRFHDAYKRVMDSKVDFSDEFLQTISLLKQVTYLEQAIINLMLYKDTFNKKYLFKFIKISIDNNIVDSVTVNKLQVLCNTESEEYSNLYELNAGLIENTIDNLLDMLIMDIKNLPKPTDSDYVRANKRREMEVSINKCMQFIKTNKLSNYTLLHFDFSGYRNIQKTKNINVPEKVQRYIDLFLPNEDGLCVCANVGSNTFGTIIFKNLKQAIDFAQKLCKSFSRPGLDQIEFKFGCSCKAKSENLYCDIKAAWNEASVASKLSNNQYTYYAGFVIQEDTYIQIDNELKKNFIETITDDGRKYYIHDDFEKFESERIINYKDNVDNDIKIGIITALPEEFVAMKTMLSSPKMAIFPKNKKNTGREFCIGKISSIDGQEHHIALTKTIGTGNVSAAIRANDLIERFPNIDIIMMTGIAGGIPVPQDKEKHIRLGDVVISQEIIDYDFVSETAKFVELRGPNIQPSPRLMEAQDFLHTNAMLGVKPWEKYIDEISSIWPDMFKRPSNDTDILYDIDKKIIPHPDDSKRNLYPYIFNGKIASANRILKNPIRRDELREQYSVCAVEMEGSGVAKATWEAEIGYYVIRGISDYCDGNKNDVWHNYAALVAAAYTRALIEKLPY